MIQFGLERSGLPIELVQEGFASGVMYKVAERLYDLYRVMDLPNRKAKLANA